MNPFKEKTVTYKILPEYQLIIEIFYGGIHYEDVLQLKNIEVADKDYNPGFNFIVVMDQAEMLLKKSDYEKYVSLIKSDKRIVSKRKSALLTNTPHQVVSMYFYEQAAKELPIDFKVFSTMDSALNWVEIDNDLISKLKTEIEIIVKKATQH